MQSGDAEIMVFDLRAITGRAIRERRLLAVLQSRQWRCVKPSRVCVERSPAHLFRLLPLTSKKDASEHRPLVQLPR